MKDKHIKVSIQKAVAVATYYAVNGEYGGAMNYQTYMQMKKLFPDGPEWDVDPLDYVDIPKMKADVEVVMEAYCHPGKTSAAGSCLLSPNIIQQLFDAPNGTQLATVLTKMINLILTGKIPEECWPVYNCGNGSALYKDESGKKIRPLVVSSIHKRDAGHVFNKLLSDAVYVM